MPILPAVFLPRLLRVLNLTAVFLVLAAVSGLLVRFHLDDPAQHGWIALFDPRGERNAPRCFATLLIMLCSAAMALLAESDRPANRHAWQTLSLLFVALAADELMFSQQRLLEPVRLGLHSSGLLAYGAAAAVIGLSYLRFLLRLPRAVRNGLVAAVLVYLGGALVLGTLAGACRESGPAAQGLPYELVTTLEATLKMAGMMGLLKVLLRHLTGARRSGRRIRQAVSAVGPRAPLAAAMTREA